MQQGMLGVQPGVCILRVYCTRRGDMKFSDAFAFFHHLQGTQHITTAGSAVKRQTVLAAATIQVCPRAHDFTSAFCFGEVAGMLFGPLALVPLLAPFEYRVRWDVPPLWGLQLPAIELFEMHVSAQQLLILVALGWAFGWRIVLFLAIVCKFLALLVPQHHTWNLICCTVRELCVKAVLPLLLQLLSSR